MNDKTRIRKLAKIWVAFNDRTIEAPEAIFKIHELFKEECQAGWMRYMNMTDETRKRWLREIGKS